MCTRPRHRALPTCLPVGDAGEEGPSAVTDPPGEVLSSLSGPAWHGLTQGCRPSPHKSQDDGDSPGEVRTMCHMAAWDGVPPPTTSQARQTLPRPEGQGPGQAPAGPTQEPFTTRGRPLRSAPVLMSGCRHICQGLWVGTVQPWARVGTGTGPELPREPARPACCPRPQSAHYGGPQLRGRGTDSPESGLGIHRLEGHFLRGGKGL